MLNANIVDHIGSKVTVWTKDGNAAENRQLHTVDEFGIVISSQDGKRTFIPWCQVKYVDYVDKAVESTPEEVKLELSTFSTADLTKELMNRVGVEHMEISVEEKVQFNVSSEQTGYKRDIEGPAIILIDKD